MLFDFFVFWVFVLCLSELRLSKNHLYSMSVMVTFSLLIVVLLFAKNYDLFASVLLVLYSSVFLLLGLFTLYFGRYWGKSNSGWKQERFILGAATIFLFSAMSSFFIGTRGTVILHDGLVTLDSSWAQLLVCYDFYTLSHDYVYMSVVLMHSVLYKLYVVENLFLNVYLLLGLVCAVALSSILRGWINPAAIVKLVATSSFNGWFSAFKDSRILTVNKFKRQLRRKNTSSIKYKNVV